MSEAGWSLFLACSWTWCIGMYLPLVALRDYGWWGFVVFALPNVIGCAAFGYVLRNRAGSDRFLHNHTAMARVFSTVTIAFHMFFIPMMLVQHFSDSAIGARTSLIVATGFSVYAVGWLLAHAASATWRWLATFLYGGSLLFLIATLAAGSFSFELPTPLLDRAMLPFLALASIFGFAFCPYLDLTFHRALRESPTRDSFLGFGILFAVMICFTAVYAVTGFDALILVHILAQSSFTVGAHLREIRATQGKAPGTLTAMLCYLPLLALPLAVVPVLGHDPERLYQFFMVAYALVFPAYVWIVAQRRPLVSSRGRGTAAWMGFVVVSLPAFYAAFIAHVAWPIVLPFVVLAVWTAVSRLSGSATDTASSAASL